MKLRVLCGLSLLVFGVALLSQGQPQTMTEDEGRILALETAWNHAEQNKDVAASTNCSLRSSSTSTMTAR